MLVVKSDLRGCGITDRAEIDSFKRVFAFIVALPVICNTLFSLLPDAGKDWLLIVQFDSVNVIFDVEYTFL